MSKNKTKVMPSNDQVLVQFDVVDEVKEGGIYVAGKSESITAEVLAVGPLVENGDEAPCKVGDRVIIGHQGFEAKLGGEKFVLVQGKHILAVVEGE